MFNLALRLCRYPILFALLITPTRFFLELAGVPDIYVFLIGLLWLTLASSIYWAVKLIDHQHPYRTLMYCLAIFSPISRVPVFILWWITKTWELGTHYNIFDNWSQALIGQLFYGSLIQIVPGMLVGSLILVLLPNFRKKQRLTSS
ncbi:hypothetical protein [Aliikangiella sp. G2MR2-5]|uniref:hypothetical protein n=1 Tax=Aliikangiella sp. G2MR2-5 TaxID=2788943 RepID=UPI0018AA17F1|nr:hypothetical protein [Aliikangiella sp. G2MR2-5]